MASERLTVDEALEKLLQWCFPDWHKVDGRLHAPEAEAVRAAAKREREEAYQRGCLVAKDSVPVKLWLDEAYQRGLREAAMIEASRYTSPKHGD